MEMKAKTARKIREEIIEAKCQWKDLTLEKRLQKQEWVLLSEANQDQHDTVLKRLERLKGPRAGSIFTPAEEIAQEWILRDLLGETNEQTEDVSERLGRERASLMRLVKENADKQLTIDNQVELYQVERTARWEAEDKLEKLKQKLRELIKLCDKYAEDSSDFSKFDKISNELEGLLG
jgi:predicted transcriptional regulator